MNNVPRISHDFFVIVNRPDRELAAVISSYLNIPGYYLLMFEFPFVSIPKPEVRPQTVNKDFLSVDRAFNFDIQTHNVLHKIKDVKFIILAGLTCEQRSYLSYLDKYAYIEIQDIEAINSVLKDKMVVPDKLLKCHPTQVLIGLHMALRNKCILSIDETAGQLECLEADKEGLLIIEDIPAVSSVVAINYAAYADADVKVVNSLEKGDDKRIKILIENWRRKKFVGAYPDLIELIRDRLAGVYFPQYRYVTFFTTGIPYSLYMKNGIACSYVHLLYRPDFFIFNNLFFEIYRPLTSAIVFSTSEFAKHDETIPVIKALTAQDYYVRELVDQNASSSNLDLHIRHFAYGLLHISSHGGQIRGVTILKEFRTEDSRTHIFEYDEIVTFSPMLGMELIPVIIKWFPRRLNGYIFGSTELDEQHYPSFVYEALDGLYNNKNEGNIISKERKDSIVNSCSISCSDFDYQAGFDRVAGGVYAPIVFNNSCWSWTSIADEFLNAGVRGYIGTLFAIGTPQATKSAIEFYENCFNEPLINSVLRANDMMRGTTYEDVYIFYGLHFSTFKKGESVEQSRRDAASRGLDSLYTWMAKVELPSDEKTKQRIKQLIEWNMRQLQALKSECESILMEKKKKYKSMGKEEEENTST